MLLKKKEGKQMNSLEYYMSLPYKVEIVPDMEEGGYTAYCPDLPGCITCSETMDGIIENIIEAKKCWFEAALKDGFKIPDPSQNLEEYSGQFKLRIPKSLHKTLAENAKKEGVSMNQYCVYLLSANNVYRSNN